MKSEKDNEIKELKRVNEKLKTFHKELDDQVNDLLQKHKSLKQGLFAFLEIEQLDANTLIAASEDHEFKKVAAYKEKIELLYPEFLSVWENSSEQIGKIDLINLLKKEIETVFKVADAGDNDFEKKNEN